MTRRVRLYAVVGSLIASLLVSAPATAHNPTVGDNPYPNLFVEEFDWAPAPDTPPAWFQPQFEAAAEVDYARNNHTRAPTFTKDLALNDNYIRYQTDNSATGIYCFDPVGWDACIEYDANNRLETIIYNSETNWCEAPSTDANGCMHVGRVALHELGHAAGLARSNQHSGELETYTVMRANTPVKASTGWTRDQLMRCDLIELQREYDVTPLSSTYADCVDHLPAAGLRSGKIKTYITLNDPTNSACINTFVTLSGTGLIANEPSSLGLIAGNPLSARTARILRRPVGGTFSLHATTSIANTANWSFSVTSSTATTYEYQAEFSSSEVALSSDESSIFAIQWRTSFC